MSKRYISTFMLFCLLAGLLIVKLGTIATGEISEIAASNSSMKYDTDTSRGYIYDCNMHPLVNISSEITAAAKPTAAALSELYRVLDVDSYEALKQRAEQGLPLLVRIPSGAGKSFALGCDDIKTLSVLVRYGSESIAEHVIGYCDSAGDGVSATEKSFNDYLTAGNRTLSASFKVDAGGRVLAGEKIKSNTGSYYSKSGVQLTIDSDIQKIVEKSMDGSNIERGAAVVLDVKTGAIKAMVSRPDFSAGNIAKSIDDENSPLLNRAISAYSVGSIFKTVVAAAALEKGISKNYEYVCTGKTVLNGVTFNCHEHDGHGKLNMSDALKYSCNPYFINLAQQLDATDILSVAAAMGYGERITFSDGFFSASGNLPKAEDFDSAASLANLAFGQGALTATPLTISAAMLCIVSQGEYREPYLIKALINGNGEEEESFEVFSSRKAISSETAQIVKDFLASAGEYALRQSDYGVSAGGKTATAQSGQYENGREMYNTWYCGFFPADNPEYIVTVIKENGESGATDCLPVFEKIASETEKIL